MAADDPGPVALAGARERVRAEVAAGGSGPPPPVRAPNPIAALPSDVEDRMRARVQAELTPLGTRYPRRPMLVRVAVPSTILAVLDAIGLVIALVAGHTALAVVAVILLVLFAVVAVGAWRQVLGDPLRLTLRDRRVIERAARWSPTQAWNSTRSATAPGALARTAAQAGQRIVDTPAWRTGALAGAGLAIGLAAELDLVTEHCFTLTGAAEPDRDPEWDRLVTRVAALVAYADTVDVPESRPIDPGTIRFLVSPAVHGTD